MGHIYEDATAKHPEGWFRLDTHSTVHWIKI